LFLFIVTAIAHIEDGNCAKSGCPHVALHVKPVSAEEKAAERERATVGEFSGKTVDEIPPQMHGSLTRRRRH
jgi:hypothetical protein